MGLIVRSSDIHAAGVYTTAPIKKDTQIVEYTGPIVSRERADELYEGRPYTYLFGLDDGRIIQSGTTQDVFDQPSINAFVTRGRSCVMVGLSSGAVNGLSPRELEFVIGHELGNSLGPIKSIAGSLENPQEAREVGGAFVTDVEERTFDHPRSDRGVAALDVDERERHAALDTASVTDDDDFGDIEALLRHADALMYEVKTTTRNGIRHEVAEA